MKNYIVFIVGLCTLLFCCNVSLFASDDTDSLKFEISLSSDGINKLQKVVDSSPYNKNSNNISAKSEASYNWDLIATVTTVVLALITGLIVLVKIITKLATELYDVAKKSSENANKKAEAIEDRFIKSTQEAIDRKLNRFDLKILEIQETTKKLNILIPQIEQDNLRNKVKVSAMQKTLILCLEKAPTRDIAFSTYSKLLAAYEVLLNNSNDEHISSELQEEMEMAATLVYGNKQYVRDEIIRFMIEHMNLPYEVRGILWGSPQ